MIETQAHDPHVPLKLTHVAAVAAGNALEFYDFILYSTFAIFIGHAYFPAHGAGVSLLLSLATFGIGFVTRPIGSIVLGRVGDAVGRKPAMLISFTLMALGLLGVAVTPTYAQIGLAAPVIVILSRLVQGFALGGEVGPSTAYLIEAAPPHRRGLIGSMQITSQNLANLVGAVIALGLSLLLPRDALAEWGWRVAFLVGLFIVPFGMIVRRSLQETAPARAVVAVRQPFPWRLVIASTVTLAGATMITYTGSYLVTFAMDSLHLPPSAAFGVGVTGGLCGIIFCPIGGWLSDRYGRRWVMIPGSAVTAVLVIPIYSYLISHPTPFALYVCVAAIAAPTAFAGAPIILSITESFPARMRCFAVGVIYAVTIAVFGGFTQFAIAALIHATGQPMAIGYYRLAASVIMVVGMLILPESAPSRIRVDPLSTAAAQA
ncbi:MAG TPA: MFS transporter [Caulobacteraceae bacterium]